MSSRFMNLAGRWAAIHHNAGDDLVEVDTLQVDLWRGPEVFGDDSLRVPTLYILAGN